MSKKIVSVFFTFLIIFNILCIKASAQEPEISAQSAVVMIAATGEVVYSKNEYAQRGIASTTKIMTCITALENADLTETTVAKAEDVNIEGTSIGLKAGDKVDLLTLIKGMLLESGNDAANVTASLVAGGKEAFAQLMNHKASQLGMTRTSFKNPSGLTEEGHYSCAYDMALLGSYAVKNSLFRSICSMKRCEVFFGEPLVASTFYNHNKLIGTYDGAFGIKTGFTKASGRCLVSAVERDGVVLVAVTLNAYDDWNDHKKLYDYSFPLLKLKTITIPVSSYNVPVVNSSQKLAEIDALKDIKVAYLNKEPEYNLQVFLPKFIYAPVYKNDFIGWAELYTKEGILIDKVYFTCKNNIQPSLKASEDTLVDKLLKYLEKDRR